MNCWQYIANKTADLVLLWRSIRKPKVISGAGGGGCAPHVPTPRSAPGRSWLINLSATQSGGCYSVIPSLDRKVSAYSFYIIALLGSYLLKAISNFSNRATRFKGYRQQDSQELLRYLLDSVRNEELRVNLQVFFLIGWSNFISDNVTEIRESCAFSVKERKETNHDLDIFMLCLSMFLASQTCCVALIRC